MIDQYVIDRNQLGYWELEQLRIAAHVVECSDIALVALRERQNVAGAPEYDPAFTETEILTIYTMLSAATRAIEDDAVDDLRQLFAPFKDHIIDSSPYT